MDFFEFITKVDFSNIVWEIITPLIFNLVDIVTGCIQAFINNNFKSSTMRKGLLHKASMILCLLLGFIVMFAFKLEVVPKIISIYIIFMEIVSIYENLKKMGISFINIEDIFKKGE